VTQSTKQAGFFAGLWELASLLLLVLAIRVFLFGLYQVPTGSMETTMLVGERFFADKLSYFFRKPVRGDIISFNDPEFRYSSNPVMNILQQYVFGPFPFNLGPANWTKRVIGVPGDHVEGRVEDGKPVVYVNGNKLDEPYLNKYPLMRVWKQDLDSMLSQLHKDVRETFGDVKIDPETLEQFAVRHLDCCPRSYDPSVSYENQPFYRINPARIVPMDLLYPGTLIRPDFTEISVRSGANFWNGSDVFSIKLGDDEYWCMGDNRLGSRDCRSFGPIKGKNIHGRILFCIWSIDSNESWWIWDLIKHPIDFWTRVRWGRCLKWVL